MPRKPDPVPDDSAARLESLRRQIAAVREESIGAAATLELLKKHAGILSSRGGIEIFRQNPGEEPAFEDADPEDILDLRRRISMLSGTTSTFQGDIRLVKADAVPKTVRIHGAVSSWTEAGAPDAVVGIRYEITDKLAKIGEIGERAIQLRELLDNATVLFYRYDLKGDCFRYSNRSAQQFPAFRECLKRGLAIEEENWDIHPDDIGRFARTIRAAIARPVPAKFALTIEYRRRNIQGQYRWLYEKITFLRDDANTIDTVIGSAVDVTALKEIQEAIRESERRYRMMIELSTDIIWILDLDMRLVFSSAASFRMLGYTQEEMFRLAPGSTLVPESFKRFKAAIREYLSREMARPSSVEPQRCELTFRRKDGSFIQGELVFCAYRDDSGRLFGICGATRDITERKTVEEEMRRTQRELERRIADRSEKLSYINTQLNVEMERRKQMEYFMLHHSERDRAFIGRELNEGLCQELVGIMCLCEVVRENQQGRDTIAIEDVTGIRDLLADAVKQARAMAKGLNPLLADPRSLDNSLELLAERTSEMFDTACRFTHAGSIEIGNPDQALSLYRIAQEAVHNAIRHGKARNIEIELDGDEGNVRLTVADNGCGRAGTAGNPSGMGLKIMAYRMQAMSGTLRITDRQGGGVKVECSAPKR
ncbi:PAS domain S-box protein [Candidatus Ozemobacteraceae bacterium]|nr:PAS domain S-box protein [Candidatus Ozemobacteraceae bacterium]